MTAMPSNTNLGAKIAHTMRCRLAKQVNSSVTKVTAASDIKTAVTCRAAILLSPIEI